jgi:hypothetical protein
MPEYLSDKDIDSLVQAEYEEALARGEQWAEEAYEAHQVPRPILVTKAQGRYLAYLDRCGYATESRAAHSIYGPSNRGGGSAITRMVRTLRALGLIEEKTDIRRRNLWNKTWKRTDKPYEVGS